MHEDPVLDRKVQTVLFEEMAFNWEALNATREEAVWISGADGFQQRKWQMQSPWDRNRFSKDEDQPGGPVARAEEATGRQKERRAFIIYGNNFHRDLVRDIKKPNIKIFSDSL